MTQPQGGVAHALDNKARAARRLTPWSIPWIVLIAIGIVLAAPYEIYCVATMREGGPLTHVVKWAYGDQYSARWWFLGWTVSAFGAWCIPHFLFDGLGLRSLLIFLGTGLLIAVVGYLITK